LSNNNLSGLISFVDNLSGLSVLRLDRNNFTGPLPTLDGLLLQVFSVAHNRLTGLVPPPPLHMPADMEIVSLAGNLLGPVPQFATTVQNDVAEATATGSFCRLGPGPCDPDVTSLCQASTRRCTPATRMEARRKTSSHSGTHARHTWNTRWFLALRTTSSFLFFLFSSYRKGNSRDEDRAAAPCGFVACPSPRPQVRSRPQSQAS
jgi:hypothetical protein